MHGHERSNRSYHFFALVNRDIRSCLKMKVLAFNGSPRKDGNTATLLSKALEGAASQGAETEIVHLYDLDFKGCRGCNACKLPDARFRLKCVHQDGLAPVLEKAVAADALLLGSPVYFGGATGEMRCFLERLLYPRLMAGIKKSIPVAFIYGMNASEAQANAVGIAEKLRGIETQMKWSAFEPRESLFTYSALQFNDLSRYFPAKLLETTFKEFLEKEKVHGETFGRDCEKAFGIGERIVKDREVI